MDVGHNIRVCTLISVVRPNNEGTLQRQYQERNCVMIDTSTATDPGYHVVSVVRSVVDLFEFEDEFRCVPLPTYMPAVTDPIIVCLFIYANFC